MTFADSFLKHCWDAWWTQSVYARVLTCWLVPFIPLVIGLDLLCILCGPLYTIEDLDDRGSL